MLPCPRRGERTTELVVSEEQVRRALATVIDPCSRSMGDDLSLTELGMVDGLVVRPSCSTTRCACISR